MSTSEPAADTEPPADEPAAEPAAAVEPPAEPPSESTKISDVDFPIRIYDE